MEHNYSLARNSSHTYLRVNRFVAMSIYARSPVLMLRGIAVYFQPSGKAATVSFGIDFTINPQKTCSLAEVNYCIIISSSVFEKVMRSFIVFKG